MIVRSEKFISICSDSQAALKVLQTVQNIPNGMAVPMGIEWHFHPLLSKTSDSLDILEYVEMKVPMSLQRRFHSTVFQTRVGLGVLRRSIKNKKNCRLVNHHSTLRQVLTSTQRWVLELILSFNRMQSSVIGLLTGHNTMRKHFYILGLMASPWFRSWSPEEETSTHVLLECEALAPLSLTYLGGSLWILRMS